MKTIRTAAGILTGFIFAALTIDWLGTAWWARVVAILTLLACLVPLPQQRNPRQAP